MEYIAPLLSALLALGIFVAVVAFFESGWAWRIFKWLVMAALALAALAALFSCIASIIHFQIIMAVAYFLAAAATTWAFFAFFGATN